VRWSRLVSFTAATAAAFVVLVPPAAAAPRPGKLDPSFSGNGIASIDLDHGGFDEFSGLAVRGSTVFATGEANDRLTLVKLRPSGHVDASFGAGDGIVRVELGRRAFGRAVAFLPHGRIVVVGGLEDARGYTRLVVVVFRSDGHLYRGFSGDGHLALRPPGRLKNWFGHDVVVPPDGKIVAIGESYSSAPRQRGNFAVARIKPSGALDRTFSRDGMVSVNFRPGDDGAWEGRLMRDGRLVVAGWVRDGNTHTWDTGVARLRPSGRLDTTFSRDGKVVLDLYRNQNDLGQGVALRATGAVVVGSRTSGTGGSGITQPRIAQLTKHGALDMSFGGGDGKAVGFARGSYFDDLAIDGSRRIVGVTGDVVTGNLLSFRLTRSGRPDRRYGRDGVVTTGVNGTVHEMVRDRRGRPVSAGSSGQDSAVFRVIA
jgi:uncharacterized delta-60 repeat protein